MSHPLPTRPLARLRGLDAPEAMTLRDLRRTLGYNYSHATADRAPQRADALNRAIHALDEAARYISLAAQTEAE